MGDMITLDGKGGSCFFEGRVIDLRGNPIEGARLRRLWSENPDGYYDVRQPGIQPQQAAEKVAREAAGGSSFGMIPWGWRRAKREQSAVATGGCANCR